MANMERIGIFGGSFDPVHIGHVQSARQAAKVLGLDRLLMIPAAAPPHKNGCFVSGEHRLSMLRIACGDDPVLQPSDMELRRIGPSYTYETVEAVRAAYPEAEIFLLMGSDMFLSILNWKNPERILAQAKLAVFCRGDKGEKEKIAQQKVLLEQQGSTVFCVENNVVQISSTQMRRLLAFQCADEFLPAGVGDYIRQNGLYNINADWKNLPMPELEKVVIRLLNPNRVNHVLGCRDTAARLARIWGVDETDAARAGMLHDVTKAIDGPLQLTLCRAYGKVLSEFSKKYPKTLHALTGSLVAERIFGENEKVVSAIECHTTGKGNMTMLEKIIYVADYMEPNRDFPGVDKLRHYAETDMDAALKLGLETTLEHLKRQGAEVSPESREALEYLKMKI
ncbi:MAG: nicotinate (nicotinamide) nucleotide adenylyltransferase [Ruminococcaceae bacterium]|nr:nicotinate (nicotinamide) nucleotide adenylyltransferase [Oscillospiraceae bacterium]